MNNKKLKRIAADVGLFTSGLSVGVGAGLWAIRKLDGVLEQQKEYIRNQQYIAEVRDVVLTSYANQVDGETLERVINESQFSWVLYQSGVDEELSSMLAEKLAAAQESLDEVLSPSEVTGLTDVVPVAEEFNPSADPGFGETIIGETVQHEVISEDDEDTGWEAERDAAVMKDAKPEN